MRTRIYFAAILALLSMHVFGQMPDQKMFDVRKISPAYGPTITSVLQDQTELAWRQDLVRRESFKNVRNEKDLLALQKTLSHKVLAMIGGLPGEKTPLRPRHQGRISMDGYRVEKLVFESLPGFHVTALVYVPENGAERHPAVLVACGHSPVGKIYYQALCQRLVKRGYLVICWDPVGQGERSQYWDAKSGKSRYNLVCGEHAVMGNLAYLAGANLLRWQIWDGIRTVDYLKTRDDVDTTRLSITGTSGGGVQAAYIGALDERIKVVIPSCFITSLPMRAYNRIFADPDSDPEQDPFGLISEGVDHAGLLLLVYPRPIMIAAAVLDFFPIEGTRSTYREIADIYDRFKMKNRIAMVEGYHKHQFSIENQEAAIQFLDRFNGMPITETLPAVDELNEKDLQCTPSGQVLVEYPYGKNMPDLILAYFQERRQLKKEVPSVSSLYYGNYYPNINRWSISIDAKISQDESITWQKTGCYSFNDVKIDHYLLRHSGGLEIPLLYFHSAKNRKDKTMLWVDLKSKATQKDWAQVSDLVRKGENVISFDFRGTGEERMNFQATPSEYLTFTEMDSIETYFNPLSGVFANYTYNALLTGRPYFLQMIEDVEIVSRFIKEHLRVTDIKITGRPEAKLLMRAVVETLPQIKPRNKDDVDDASWAEIINQKQELWPIHNLLPGGAYIH